MDGVDVKKITDETFTKDKKTKKEKGRDFFNSESKVSHQTPHNAAYIFICTLEEGGFQGPSQRIEDSRCRTC